MANYFAYFTEIEDRFQKRRGTFTLLSTLDWALIETWREAGVPLQAVLRGIDDAFDKRDARALKSTRRMGKVNGLAWAVQSVMAATEQMKSAAVGSAPAVETKENGFEAARLINYLSVNAAVLEGAALAEPAATAVRAIGTRLRELSGDAESGAAANLEDLERSLTVLEERLYAALTLITPEDEMALWREQAARGLSANRGGMSAVQLRQVTQQFLNKRLLARYQMPRLSLFYLEHQ